MMEQDAVAKTLDRLRRDVDRLLNLEDIRGAITAYARACDRGNDPVALRPLFTDDASWECKGFGRYEGGDRVCAALKAIAGEKIWWSLHYMISPSIQVTPGGTSASAFWYLWEAATLPHEATGQAEACMIGATYEATLRRVDGVWRFSAMELILNMASPLNEGWVRKRFPAGNAGQPYFMQLEPGNYAWCACGKSQTQPFCDGSHEGSRTAPVEFTLAEKGNRVLCGCRYSRDKTFCDGSHLNLKLP
jgi:CDGSH-type Zn-finger protein